MSRRRQTRRPTRSFTRLLAWTTLLALVFSAGIITGQRLLSGPSGPLLQHGPPVSLSTTASAAIVTPVVPDDVKKPAADKPKPTTFSFYDLLSRRSGPPRPSAVDKPERAPLTPDSAKPLPARYTLQVGAHPSLDEARQQMDDLRRAGLEPNLISVPTEQGRVFRVRVGKFHNLKEARHFQAELKTKRELQALVTPI